MRLARRGRVVPKVTARNSAKKKRKGDDAGFEWRAAVDALLQRLRTGAALALGAAAIVGAIAFVVMWAGGYLGSFADGVAGAAGDGARSAGYEVARVTIVGRKETDPVDIEEAIGPLVGASILSVDLDSIRNRVEALGWVEAAAVRRLLPDTVQVSIRERTPSAVWQNKGALHLIDRSGVIIRPVFGPEYANLPLIVGAGAPEAASEILPALARRPALMERATALTRVSKRRWDVRLRSGADLKLPEEGVGRALDTLERLQDTQALLDQPLEYINLLDPDRMVVRRKGEQAPVDATAESASERS